MKRGADKIVSVYWFVILFIVAGTIVYIVAVFYGKPYDVRSTEANLLANKLADCISEAGYIKLDAVGENGISLTNENILKICKLNFKTEGGFQDDLGEYYIEIKFNDFNSGDLLSSINSGNANLKEFCNSQYSDSSNAPACVQRSFYTIDKSSKQYKIDLISIVRKSEKNVA